MVLNHLEPTESFLVVRVSGSDYHLQFNWNYLVMCVNPLLLFRLSSPCTGHVMELRFAYKPYTFSSTGLSMAGLSIPFSSQPTCDTWNRLIFKLISKLSIRSVKYFSWTLASAENCCNVDVYILNDHINKVKLKIPKTKRSQSAPEVNK